MLELVRQLALTIESPVWEAVRSPAPWKIKALLIPENVIGDTIESRQSKPSPEGEGWVRENKNKEKRLFDSPHPNLLPEGEGAHTFEPEASKAMEEVNNG
jgi:hypothetical protein